MNKDKLKETVGHIVRVQPPARGPFGEVLDDDWKVTAVQDNGVADLEHLPTKHVAAIAADGVNSYQADAERTTAAQQYGVLQLHVQIELDEEKKVSVSVLPPPRIAHAMPDPLDDERARRARLELTSFASWNGSKQAMHALLVGGPMSGFRLSTVVQGIETTLLERMAQSSILLNRVSPFDGRSAQEVVYEINPTLRPFLEKAIAQDPQFKTARQPR